jgi:uncharacterized repeat protein (TIGR03803 family)
MGALMIELNRSRKLASLPRGGCLLAVFMLAGLLATSAAAQAFTVLHSFTGGIDGANPYAGLVLSGNTLYGTAAYGGRWGFGTVFAVNTDGTGFTNLHSFYGIGSERVEGGNPNAGLVLSGSTLYGTTCYGGNSDKGTVFAVNTDGSGFTNLHSFTSSDGNYPSAGLITDSSGTVLYGTTFEGGSGYGTVFAVNTDGSGFTNLKRLFQNLVLLGIIL